jgi:hypothetical protein
MNPEIVEQIPLTTINTPIPIRSNPEVPEAAVVPRKSLPKENRRFSILEANRWREMFVYNHHQNNNQQEDPQDDLVHEIEDAQWREVLGCDNYRSRIVSAPLPTNPDKISGFVKRKSDPVQLPSSRRVSIIETEKWKNMFACDSNFDSHGGTKTASAATAPPPQAEDESWREFFGCQPDSSSTPLSHHSPPKGSQLTPHTRSPQMFLSPITERDSENSSSNGSADLPKPKLMTYIRALIHSKKSFKKKQTKAKSTTSLP